MIEQVFATATPPAHRGRGRARPLDAPPWPTPPDRATAAAGPAAWIDLYATTMRIAIAEQFQYRVANYFYMIGMIAEPIVYLVVWTTVAEPAGRLGRRVSRPGEFAAYYIVWTLVRNMNIVFTPFGWEERIREGQFSGQLLRPVHPIHWDLGYFAGWKVVVIVLWLPIAYVLSLLFHPTAHITLLGRDRVPDLDLGRLPDPLAQPVDARHGDLLDDARRAGVQPLLRRRAAALRPPRAAAAAARVGPPAGRDPAVPVHVRVPDRGPDRRPPARGAPRRARRCRALWIVDRRQRCVAAARSAIAIRRYSAVGG